MAQARIVIERLSALRRGLEFETRVIRTAGDRAKNFAALERMIRRPDGQGVFVKEIDRALLARKIDLGVHSLKDVPTQMLDGLAIGAVLERTLAHDLFVGRAPGTIEQLPPGSVIGTSSPRRAAQVRAAFPALRVVELRGNLDTRLRQLADERGKLDGIIVSAAGYRRLRPGQNQATQDLPPDLFLPAPAQGAIGVTCRQDDAFIRERLEAIHDPKTAAEVAAERALLARLEAGCTVPLGALAETDDSGLLRLRAMVVDPDGGPPVRAEATGDPAEPDALASAVEMILKSRGAERILSALRARSNGKPRASRAAVKRRR
jgi:hydroxymethylbilane synthase